MGLNHSTLFLNRDAVEAVNLDMRRIIEIVEEALIEKAHNRVQMPAKHWMERDNTRWFGGMSSLVPKFGYAAMKWQSGSEENAAKGIPYLTGLLFLNSIEDGLVASVMDSTWITQQRTAAASAVAIKHLANPGEESFGVIGAGVQARSHLEALGHVMPSLGSVVIYDVNGDASRKFAKVVEAAGLAARIVNTPYAVFAQTSVVITCGRIQADMERLADADWVRPGLTTVAIDYDCYWKPSGLRAIDHLLTDDLGQIEHIKPYGYFVDSPKFKGELGSVAAGLLDGRKRPEDTIAVMNMGVAVEDVGTAKAIFEAARAMKLGQVLQL
ncbi:ornithine cyclodeaminase family protein [Mesorhizobium sp. BH1-1-5]|uniref:ornithine cyclodeaminase family protein n=1 Tax=unclassified Mesorhizobium TaxID=325217 RepID=UPI00112832E6|nr:MULTISPECIES: ornithine cyclodeaminase family protein [unclassified Mesorhizobium]MBZ9988868.1 ornithine cyclodeaminase family protein [Mesorhizobium sp. BH1-1-5]TPJ61062.1 ornithine cyclodeaminase family protein [Mesorhizobium sp. B2-7-1]